MIREGRLGRGFDKEVALYTSSLGFDRGLLEYDIYADMAHALMLHRQGLLDGGDAKRILALLKEILEKGLDERDLDPDMEDIHMAVEARLTRELGDAGGRLHQARSRNDQVATDLRMKARDDVNALSKATSDLISTLLATASEHTGTVMPAFTHLQHAQPTTLAHHLLSYADSLLRSMERLDEVYRRIDRCPLGAGAVATTSHPIDREMTAGLLGFAGVLENSMDAVSTRDYMVEAAAAAVLIAMDLSKMAAELVIWSTPEFSYIELADEVASTSSIMPQKKNPDVLELIRARYGTAAGGLVSLLTILGALPQSYNRDLQEASPAFFSLIEGVTSSLSVMSKVIRTMKVNAGEMKAASTRDFSTATDLADLIVKERGLPFRTAHQIVGAMVSMAIKEGVEPGQVSSELLDRAAESVAGEKLGLSEEAIKAAMDPVLAVKARSITGGPAPEDVEKAIKERQRELKKREQTLRERESRLNEARKRLLESVSSILEA
ncbi:MAG: argininosuccinate lyase [Methanobacteriota archaeon]|nr:MAG: argininosuccinate lyase [Euryarchaeota archaeon]